jgi:MFS transporter, DHA1 family, multidrug resistance protein
VVDAAAARPARSAPELVIMLGCATAFGPLSTDMYVPALPAMAAELGVPAAGLQLTLTACLVGLAAGQLAGGTLSDRCGRRRPILAGLAGFAALSMLIAAAPSLPALIALRLVQGFAGGVAVVVARAVVRDLHAGRAAAKFYSRLVLVFGLGPILGPALGGAVLRVTSWRGIFVLLGLLALLAAALLAARLPETLPPGRRTGSLRAAGPVLRDRVFLGYALTQGFAFAAVFAYLANGAFVLQEGYGLTATAVGLLVGLNAVAPTALSQLNAHLLDRVAPRALLLAALAGETVAGAVALLAAFTGNLPGLLVGLFLLLAAFGMTQPNSLALALDRHPDRAGTAASVLGLFPTAVAALVGSASTGWPPARGVPMAALILACAAAALLCATGLARTRR